MHPLAEAVAADLRRDMNDLADLLANGSARSYEEYQNICGRIRGLAAAEEYVKDRAKRMEHDD